MRSPLFAAGFLIVAACSRFDEALSAEDGGSGVDAAEAGADVLVTPGTPFCSVARPGQQLFCEDFETEKLPDFGFTDRGEEGASITADRVPAAGKGFVLSYQASVGTNRNTWFRFGALAPGKDLPFKSLKLTMDVAIVSQAATGVLIAGIWLHPSPGATPIVQGIALHGNPELQASLNGLESGTPRPVTLGAWQTISVGLRSAGTGYTRNVSVDGQDLEVKTVSFPNTGDWDVRIGMYYGDQSTVTMLIDNVVVTRE